jgi:hypothetical protein
MTEELNTPAAGEDDNHVSTVRKHLLDQMRALRAAGTPDEIERELGRSKGVSELAQAVVNVAKVEVEYIKVTGGAVDLPFMKPAPPALGAPTSAGGNVQQLPAPGNGITSITRHTLKG